MLRFGYAGRLRARERKWRAPHLERNAVIGLVVLAIAFTAVWIFGLERIMLAPALVDVRSKVIQVSVIEPVEWPAVPDPPQPAVFERKPSRIVIAPPETRETPPPLQTAVDSTTSARIGSAGSVDVRLFNADGSLRMPQAKLRIGPEPIANPQEAAKARWAELELRGENPLDCERTRFASAFRTDQSVGDAVAGKYLKWIGLADPAAIAERARQRQQRAADGCDPPP